MDIRDFPDSPLHDRFVKDFQVILNDPEVAIVAEVMGGLHPAFDFVKACLENGKSVVTSNKELVARHGLELIEIAKAHKVNYMFEASCGGGIPIIRPLNSSLTADEIDEITGILNGTTNYILTKMTDESASYEDVLKEAQRLGYAEANPTADVEGFDAAYKLSILSSLAFHTKIPFSKIYREGITRITSADIQYGKQLGYALKLLAIGKNTDEGIEVRVHPTYIKNTHPLASVKDSYNAVYITGDCVEDVMLYGRGAGAMQTASAIVGDVIYCATHPNFRYSTFKNTEDADPSTKFIDNFKSAYYLRLMAHDKAGVLAKVSSIFSRHNISVAQMIQEEDGVDGRVPLVFVTHQTKEKSIMKAVDDINATSDIAEVVSVIRVVS